MTDDRKFHRIIHQEYALVLVNVLYFLPDHENLVNEFIYQVLDLQPAFPRVQRFLRFWRRELDAQIKQVIIQHRPHHPNASWQHGIILDLD